MVCKWMRSASEKAHEAQMRFDPIYRAEYIQKERIRRIALEEYAAAAARLNALTDAEIRERYQAHLEARRPAIRPKRRAPLSGKGWGLPVA